MRLPRTIAGSIESIARAAMGKDWALYATLLNHWGEIVGQEYAGVTTPVKITFPQGKKTEEKWAQGHRTGGVLTISLPQGLAMEFSFLSDTMIARINSYFGYAAIGKIALQPHYGEDKDPRLSAPPPSNEEPAPSLSPQQIEELQEQMDGLENNELKEALLHLGQSIKRQE
ncbi:MAG TPA: hypothetical protein DCY07_00960 [Rhodospirillaceae bacterium]|nr:hypothetical protein [Rhodospirillaceae bacterium]